jgi:hypothetical protein
MCWKLYASNSALYTIILSLMDANAQETLPQAEAIRFCFRFKPQDIPGIPGARSITSANAFMEANFQRKFDWEKDYVYTPAGSDEITRNLYMFLDVNKHASSTFKSLRCYIVTQRSSMYYSTFLYRIYSSLYVNRVFKKTEFHSVGNFSSMFPWGGRKMRKLEKPTIHPICAEAQGVGQSMVD